MFTKADLTPQQAQDWERCRAAVLHQAPFFTNILYSMMALSDGIAMFTKDLPAVGATDGRRLLLNPDRFFKLKLGEQVFVVAHEVMHCVFDHIGVMHKMQKAGGVMYADGARLPYDHKAMNVAQDLVINDMLIEDKIGQFNKQWLHDRKLGNSFDSVLDVYRRMFNEDPGGGGEGEEGEEGEGSGTQQGNFNTPGSDQKLDEHLQPGEADGVPAQEAVDSRNEAEWRMAVNSAMEAAKAMGKLPAGMERVLGEWLTPEVNWEEFIRSAFARSVGRGAWDWRRPNRRFITRPDPVFMPSNRGERAGVIAIGVDTSGSISGPVLNMFLGAMASIIEDYNPERLVLIWCDAEVHRVDEVEDVDDLRHVEKKGAPGGGGTDFRPVFLDIEHWDEQPEMLIFLTDGYGLFPEVAPDYPTVWGTIGLAPEKYPFGDAVEVKMPT